MLQTTYDSHAFTRTRMQWVLDQNVKRLFLGSMSPSRRGRWRKRNFTFSRRVCWKVDVPRPDGANSVSRCRWATCDGLPARWRFDPDEQAQVTIRLVFDLFERFRTVGKVLSYLVEHDIRMPVRVAGGPRKGELEWHRVNRPSLYNLFGNPIYAGAYAYGVRPTDRRRQKPGRPGTGRGPAISRTPRCFCPIECRRTSPGSNTSAIGPNCMPIWRRKLDRSAPARRCSRDF